jgi:hypothetical protein
LGLRLTGDWTGKNIEKMLMKQVEAVKSEMDASSSDLLKEIKSRTEDSDIRDSWKVNKGTSGNTVTVEVSTDHPEAHVNEYGGLDRAPEGSFRTALNDVNPKGRIIKKVK